jgi:hypothetical protein
MAFREWLAAVAVATTMAAPAAAQPIVILPDRIAVGAAVAASVNGDRKSGNHAPDVAVTLELPVFDPYRLRFDAGIVAWRFGDEDPAARTAERYTVTLKRATISVVKVARPVMGRIPIALFAGAGAGVYHYGFQHGENAVLTRAGVHALAGFDYFRANDRVIVAGELQFHDVRGPDDRKVVSYSLFVLQASLGVKYRF